MSGIAKIFISNLYFNSVRSWCDGFLDRSFVVGPLTYFSFQPVIHNWCNKSRGMCYPVWAGACIRPLAVNQIE